MELDSIFRSLNINPAGSKLYTKLLSTGPIKAGDLSKKAGIPRATLYELLYELEKKGMVKEGQKLGTKIFSAEPPEKILKIFEHSIENLEHNKNIFTKLLPLLNEKHAEKTIPPKIQMFEGQKSLQSAIRDMLLYHDIETQALWPIQKMLETLSPEFFRYLNKSRIRNNLFTRAIWPEKDVVDLSQHPYLGHGEKFKREIRVAPKNFEISMGYWIYGNRIVFISSIEENFGFIVESKELRETMLAQFEIIWHQSKTLTVDAKETAEFIKEIERYY